VLVLEYPNRHRDREDRAGIKPAAQSIKTENAIEYQASFAEIIDAGRFMNNDRAEPTGRATTARGSVDSDNAVNRRMGSWSSKDTAYRTGDTALSVMVYRRIRSIRRMKGRFDGYKKRACSRSVGPSKDKRAARR